MAAAPTTSASGPPVFSSEKSEKRLRTRTNVMNELVATEETYLRQLIELVSTYVEPLQNNRLITPEQHAALFPDIQIIVNLNSNFLQALQDQQTEWDNQTSLLGNEFLKFAPFFKMYQNYVNNHENASSVQRTLSRSSAFEEFCVQAQAQTGGLGLGALLILPIQRVPRYELCLRELLKNTEEDHPDYENLSRAFAVVREVNGSINERMKEQDMRDGVRAIEQRIGGGISLITPARKFVQEGTLIKVCRKRDRPYIFFLFTDMLMYCSVVTTTTGGEGLRMHNMLPFNGVFEVVDIETSTKYADRCFEIHSSVKSFLVYADSVADKYEWFNAIQTAYGATRIMSGHAALHPAPVWHPDDFSDHCMFCKSKFTLLKRRHHCRYCGKLVCNDCSQQRLPNLNPEERQQTVRVCDVCFDRFGSLSPDDLHPLSDDDDSDGLESQND